ncbi:hypothetical protein TNCV_1964651 [Trichonephila clavipes]|nr:hypothetical protein TNCV_1964651 [Trichonephila clavipes]
MPPHSITPVVGRCASVHRRQEETFTKGPPSAYTIVMTVHIESGFVSEDSLSPFDCRPIPSSVTLLQMEMTMREREREREWVRIAVHLIGATVVTVFSQASCNGTHSHRGL